MKRYVKKQQTPKPPSPSPKPKPSRRTISIVDALEDKLLLGAGLGDTATWSRWFSVLRAAFALPMDAVDITAFKEVAGNREPPT